jgi:hypothetical protein
MTKAGLRRYSLAVVQYRSWQNNKNSRNPSMQFRTLLSCPCTNVNFFECPHAPLDVNFNLNFDLGCKIRSLRTGAAKATRH